MELHSPKTRDAGGVIVEVVFKPESAKLVDGEATLNVLQGAVVTFDLTTTQDHRTWASRKIPVESNAEVGNLESG
jgi:hypothetical protein